jgi:hypothetical protein
MTWTVDKGSELNVLPETLWLYYVVDTTHPFTCTSDVRTFIIIIIIIIIGTTALSEPRPSLEASASSPYSLQDSSSFSPPTSWHHSSRRPPILVR